MATVRAKEWTCEEFMALPEGGPLRYEIIDGELTGPPPPIPGIRKCPGIFPGSSVPLCI